MNCLSFPRRRESRKGSMKQIFLILISFSILLSPNAFADSAKLKQIATKYQKKGIQIGIAVHDVKTGIQIFNYNANNPMNPASTMKVITSVSAVDK